MSVKVKRMIALGVCVLLLGVAVFQNIRTNRNGAGELAPTNANKPDATASTDGDDGEKTTVSAELLEYFAGARLERESDRSALSEECAMIISDEEASEADKTAAADLAKSLETMAKAETEMEAAIEGRGYEEALVFLGDEGSVEITVLAEKLDETEATAIANIAVESASADLDDISVKCMF